MKHQIASSYLLAQALVIKSTNTRRFTASLDLGVLRRRSCPSAFSQVDAANTLLFLVIEASHEHVLTTSNLHTNDNGCQTQHVMTLGVKRLARQPMKAWICKSTQLT
jgi:hypothetical protein